LQYTDGMAHASRISPDNWIADQALIVWGANDVIFPADGAHPDKRDLKDVEFHLFDSGHFLLEDRADEVFRLIHDFLTRALGGPVGPDRRGHGRARSARHRDSCLR